ncbi:MAG: ACP S-malonyltransferase [Coriobacteriales bacterium]|jgi:[acyl-carrier-protein] S-malonyltransferase|nr:ACP S-malonyltransferase [Coriobacteriales bacterium]
MNYETPQTLLKEPFQQPAPAGKTAWVFAGQGSQVAGMGRDLYESYPQVREIFDSNAAGFDLKEICFAADDARLHDTRYTQACMAGFAAAVCRLLFDAGLHPKATLGLSLGEYCALHAAEVFDAQTLLSVLGFRGAIMANASSMPSRMTAVFGLDEATVESVVSQVAKKTQAVVSCTNYNSPNQIVIGGDEAAVSAAELALKEKGAKRCVPLKTSGPFHTAFMKEAGEQLREHLGSVAFRPQKTPVVFNATAAFAADSEIPELLVKQISSPVRFAQSIRLLEEAGITSIIEIGPSTVVAGLIKKTAPSLAVTSLRTADDIRKVVDA